MEEFQVNVSQQQLPLGLQSMFNGLLSNDFFRDVDDRHRHGGLTLSFGMPNEGQVNFLGVPQWVNKHVGKSGFHLEYVIRSALNPRSFLFQGA